MTNKGLLLSGVARSIIESEDLLSQIPIQTSRKNLQGVIDEASGKIILEIIFESDVGELTQKGVIDEASGKIILRLPSEPGVSTPTWSITCYPEAQPRTTGYILPSHRHSLRPYRVIPRGLMPLVAGTAVGVAAGVAVGDIQHLGHPQIFQIVESDFPSSHEIWYLGLIEEKTDIPILSEPDLIPSPELGMDLMSDQQLYPSGDSAWKNVKEEDLFSIISPIQDDEIDWRTGRPVLIEDEEWEEARE